MFLESVSYDTLSFFSAINILFGFTTRSTPNPPIEYIIYPTKTEYLIYQQPNN